MSDPGGFQDLFSGHAALYAQARPRYPRELFQWVADHAPGRRCAWDCGTGNGQAAVSLARHFDQVFATDPSAEQIRHAQPAGTVTYRVERAEQTTLHDASVEAVCVAQAVHWFDLTRFYQEVRRVGRPDAVLAVWGYDWFRVSEAFDREFRERILAPIENDWPSAVRVIWSGYRDLPFPFPTIAAPTFQIVEQWNFRQLLAYVTTWSATQKHVAGSGTGFLSDAAAHLLPLWGDAEIIRPVTMPVHFLAGRVA